MCIVKKIFQPGITSTHIFLVLGCARVRQHVGTMGHVDVAGTAVLKAALLWIIKRKSMGDYENTIHVQYTRTLCQREDFSKYKAWY